MPGTRAIRTCSVFSLIAICALLPSPFAHAHDAEPDAWTPSQPSAIPHAAQDMAKAAQQFLAALAPDQKEQAVFDLRDEERFNWHFVPRQRKGLPIKSMNPAQRALAQALLATGLSQRGYVSAVTIMSLEQVLADIEQGKGPRRDPELYYFSIFGTPSPKGTWAWRVEGHHLSLNYTLVDGMAIAAAPAFFGSNPGEVRAGPRKGVFVLEQEEQLGRELVKSLSVDQRKLAIIATESPREIVTGNSRKASLASPAGIAMDRLTDAQKHLLMNLISIYAHRPRSEVATDDLSRITKAGLEKVHFAWAGGLEPGQGHYYRIHGPTFLIEFDNTQDHANHIHTVWRDLQHDFGEDLLLKHYQEHQHQ